MVVAVHNAFCCVAIALICGLFPALVAIPVFRKRQKRRAYIHGHLPRATMLRALTLGNVYTLAAVAGL